jgi:aminopeptidase N
MRKLPIVTAFAVAAACSSGTTSAPPPVAPGPPANVVAQPPPPPPAPDPVPPGLRLSTAVKPTHYALDLWIVPSEDTFRGKTVIALDVAEPTNVLWLHGVDLTIETAAVTVGGAAIAAKPIARTKTIDELELIGFALDKPIGPGAAELAIAYRGKLPSNESRGLYRQDERGEWYAFTQFESTYARYSFPCFDEPTFKTPFAVALHVKKEHVGVSNAPMTSQTDEANGMKVVRFADTKPLPTYLVAYAVGPFEIVDGGKIGKNKTPHRVIVPKGRSDEAAYAVKATPEIVAQLENYFGIPYPYEKLDQIAVPRKGGAMENAGLITYGLPLILFPKAEDTAGRERRFSSIAAHEIGHHWFGDLVTLAWWNDIWLNESFASWIQEIAIERWQPKWDVGVSIVEGRSNAMRGDTLATARRVRQPIESKHDIEAAFDGITYGKGGAIIAMFEHWVGPEKFQAGVHDYLVKHAHGVATTADFIAALSTAAGMDVTPVLSSFLDQVGVPNVDVELVCAKDQAPKLVLAQSRYTPAGSKAQAEQTWQVPICAKFGNAKVDGRACTVLGQAHGELVLPAKQCPRWVLANDGELGYYRARYHGDLQDKLLDATRLLAMPERIGVYGDFAALVDAGEIPANKALDRVAALARDPNRHITDMASRFMGYLSDDYVPKALRPNRARFARKVFGERAKAIGWTPAAGEPDDTRLLRPNLLALATYTAEDPAMVAKAKKLADAWIADKKAIDPDLVNLTLGIAAWFGDRAYYERLHAAAKVEKERKERNQLLGAMGGFRDPEIAKDAMALTLTDEFDIRESIGLVFSAFGHEDTRELAYAFVKQHLDELLAKLPRDSGAGFISIGAAFCDESHRADAEAFFKDRAPKWLGGPRALAQMLERAELCVARKKLYEPAAAAFLAKQ